jgi:hypothetical protein
VSVDPPCILIASVRAVILIHRPTAFASLNFRQQGSPCVLVLFVNTDDAPIDAAPPPESRAERHLRLLQELAEIGMDIARAVRAEAVAEADAGEAAPSRFGRAEPGLVFSRIARAVRQTLALEARFAEEIGKARAEAERRRVNVAQLVLQQRQEDIRDFVAQAIEAEAEARQTPDSDVERLLDDLDERLEDGGYDDALENPDAPIAELVARICEDLGVTPDWRIWDDQDWAIDYIRDRTPADIGADRWLHLYPPGPGAPDLPHPDSS